MKKFQCGIQLISGGEGPKQSLSIYLSIGRTPKIRSSLPGHHPPQRRFAAIIDLINNLGAPTDVIRHDIVCTFNDLRAYFDVKNAPQARKFSFLGAKTSIFKVINVLYTPKLRENRRKSAPKARKILGIWVFNE